jgi:di/tricarboxylate transporter
MMRFGKSMVAAALALSVSSAPVLAQAANPAAALSVSSTSARAGATVAEESELGGGFLIPLLALGAIILGILVLIDDDEDDIESP